MVTIGRLVSILLIFQLVACSWQPLAEREGDIRQPLNDPRQFRYLTLENGLEVLLISDPAADKAAASLDVNVGSRQDPVGYQGLAHFLEHMLFLGTEKYSRAGEYQEFITAHGGSHNAFTAFEHTNYFFDVSAGSLEPALDRFAQFFTAPLFNAEYVQREVNAVNSEYRARIRDDRRRELAVFKAEINPQHPFSKFSVGNLETLQSQAPEALREQLLAFYQRYYSADLMTLTVTGQESLDALQAMVVPRFEGVKDREVAIPAIQQPLFNAAELPKWLRIEPIQNRRVLSVSFPVPDPQPFWRVKPLNYIGNVLGHEGDGSLLSILKAKGWAESLSAGQSLAFKGGALFGVEINLTEAGQQHTDEILALLFENIRLLRENGVQAWRYEEQAGLAEQQFLFRTPPAPAQEVVQLAMNLQDYPAAEVIRGSYLMAEYAPEVINRFLAQLRPANALVVQVKPDAKTQLEVARYGVQYGRRALSPEQVSAWTQAPASPLALPEPNPFIAHDFDLVSQSGETGERETSEPRSLGQVEGVELWLNTDDTFEVPKGRTYLLLKTPAAAGNVAQRVKTDLWLAMVKDQLNELAYPAQLAGLSFSLQETWRGIEVTLGGYDEKQPELLAEVLEALREPQWQQARFARIKAQRLRQLENSRKRSPYEQIVADLPRALLGDQPALSELQQQTAATDMADVRRHAQTLLSGLSLTMLVDGNFSADDARKLAGTAASAVPQADVAKPVLEVVSLPEAQYTWQIPAQHEDAGVLKYLQSAETGNTARVAMGLAAQIMSADFYHRLRTEKQLGYVVNAGVYPIREVPGLIFLVQSPVAGPEALQQEIDQYLANWLKRGVTPEQFANHKTSLAKRLTEQPDNLWEAADRHWQDLLEHHLDFDSRQQLRAALEALDFQQWWELVSQDLSSQRALFIYNAGKWPGQRPAGKAIDNISEFKRELPEYRFH